MVTYMYSGLHCSPLGLSEIAQYPKHMRVLSHYIGPDDHEHQKKFWKPQYDEMSELADNFYDP